MAHGRLYKIEEKLNLFFFFHFRFTTPKSLSIHFQSYTSKFISFHFHSCTSKFIFSPQLQHTKVFFSFHFHWNKQDVIFKFMPWFFLKWWKNVVWWNGPKCCYVFPMCFQFFNSKGLLNDHKDEGIREFIDLMTRFKMFCPWCGLHHSYSKNLPISQWWNLRN